MKRLVMLLAAMLAMTVVSVDAGQVVGVATLSGANAVPPNSTPIFGIAVLNLDVRFQPPPPPPPTCGCGSDVPLEKLPVSSAKGSIDVYLTGLTPGTLITGAGVGAGSPGVTGPVKIDSGISPTNPVVATGSTVVVSLKDLFVAPADATAILGTMDAFYVEVRATTSGATVTVRGQLTSADPLQFALPFPGVVAAVDTN